MVNRSAAQPHTHSRATVLGSIPSDIGTQLDIVVRNISEQVVSLKELPCIPRHEFKVQGGQVRDHSSDINYNSVCRQIEEGLKDGFTDAEILRGVLRIIKPGDFKDMLIMLEDMTEAELFWPQRPSRSPLQSSVQSAQEELAEAQREDETTEETIQLKETSG